MSAAAQDFAWIVGRDLDALAGQIERYPDDEALWRVGGTILNPAGTLVLHLAGNLRAYVGAVLGGTGYVRDRDAEFSRRGVGRAELLALIATCRAEVVPALDALDPARLEAPYPGPLPGPLEGATTHRFLLHLCAHLGWHRGQVDYHRRLLVETPEPPR